MLLFVLLMNLSCKTSSSSDDDVKYYVDFILNEYDFIDTNNWVLSRGYYIGDTNINIRDISLIFKKSVKDTSFYAEFSLYEKGNDITYSHLVVYTKSFPYKHDTCYYGYNNNNKLIYSYKIPQSNPDTFLFMSGKYEYYYRYGLFTINQEKYYLKHRDSLKGLKGNNLPELKLVKDWK